MKKRKLGKGGSAASVIAFGAWAIGGWKWGGTDEQASVDALHAAIDEGVNFIDTAPVYGFGLSEELVGRAIASRSRDTLILASKCGLRWDRESPTLHFEGEGRRVYRCLEADSIREELARTLERLGTDYLDLYQTHWPDPETEVAEVVDTMEALREQGLIRHWGFCNAETDMLADALAIGGLSVDQERYNLLDRAQEQKNLPLCRERELAFLAYSPLAQGLLTGRIDSKRAFPEGDLRRDNPRFSPRVLDALEAVLAPVKAVARDHEVPVEQLVLAWTLTRPGVTHALVGARNAEQARTNARAGSMELTEDEIEVLQQAADAWPGFEALQERADADAEADVSGDDDVSESSSNGS